MPKVLSVTDDIDAIEIMVEIGKVSIEADAEIDHNSLRKSKPMDESTRMDDAISLNKQRKYPVVIANTLVRGGHYKATDESSTLSAQQLKILLYVISKLRPSETSEAPIAVTFTIRDFLEVCGCDASHLGGHNLRHIRQSIVDLESKYTWVGEQPVYWVSETGIDANNIVTVVLDKTVWPMLVQQVANYTMFPLRDILLMRSAYTIRLYAFLCSHVHMRNTVKLPIEELYWMLMGTPLYQDSMGTFLARVIDPAVRDINTYTPLKVNYDKIKDAGRGQKLLGLRFNIKQLSENENAPDRIRQELCLRNEIVELTFEKPKSATERRLKKENLQELRERLEDFSTIAV